MPNKVRRAKARSEVQFPAGEIDTVPNRIRLHTKAHLIAESKIKYGENYLRARITFNIKMLATNR
ncbi:hypothetical protein CVV38_03060 [Candidatus Peregrinibacteria bacterium HGW-Peregrinibacteria-1]|nr:MAG: hypothetical protein CVV38_03060 [Candidatus Peregrinibacteria bacterium HGW-Peregrinibacteria-1]